jgi:hypothetical protein
MPDATPETVIARRCNNFIDLLARLVRLISMQQRLCSLLLLLL